MALNIKDPEVDRLAAEVARLTGESKTRAVRQALIERRDRVALRVVGGDRGRQILRFLEEEVWSVLPASLRFGRPLTKKQREAILGYGRRGY